MCQGCGLQAAGRLLGRITPQALHHELGMVIVARLDVADFIVAQPEWVGCRKILGDQLG